MNKVHNESNSLKQAQQLSQQEQINQDQAQTQVNTSKQSDPIKSPNPVQITCENCNQTGQTEVKRELNLKGKLYCCFLLLCLVCFYGPCQQAYNIIHYCSNCKTKIATHIKK